MIRIAPLLFLWAVVGTPDTSDGHMTPSDDNKIVTVPVIVSEPENKAPRSPLASQWIAGATAGAAIVWLLLRRFARRQLSVVSSTTRRPAGPSESDFDWLKEHDSSP